MMTGYLNSKHNTRIGQNRVGDALKVAAPNYHQRRRTNTARQVNPIPYRADYFGEKVHIDQNEKLVMYGVTHVAAIDGHSRFIVAGATMPVKNNIVIYDKVFRNAVSTYGMFDQIRVDHGREFFLILGIQELYSHLRRNQGKIPFLQTESKRNLAIERFWPEVNSRVNYPIKTVLVDLDNRQVINMQCDVQKFCVSSVTCKVANHGLGLVMQSWNSHPIPGRGIPNIIKDASNQLNPLNPTNLPEPDQARIEYERRYRGNLRTDSAFGIDPIQNATALLHQRESEFVERFNVSQIFGNLVNDQNQLFIDALLFYINITFQLSSRV